MERIDDLLLKSTSFIKAFHLVEKFIENANLNVYFSYVIVPELRGVNIYDKNKSFQYTNQIRTSLLELVHELRYSIGDYPDAYSHFTGNCALPRMMVPEVGFHECPMKSSEYHGADRFRAGLFDLGWWVQAVAMI